MSVLVSQRIPCDSWFLIQNSYLKNILLNAFEVWQFGVGLLRDRLPVPEGGLGCMGPVAPCSVWMHQF